MRAMAKPTRLLESTVAATTMVVITTELASASRKPFQRTEPICDSAAPKLPHCGSAGISLVRSPLTVAACALSGVSRLTQIIHSSGNTMMAVPSTSVV